MAYTCAPFMPHACTYGGPSWPICVHPLCPMPALMEAPRGLYVCTLYAPCLYLWIPLMAYNCAPFMPHACTNGGHSWLIPVHPSCPMPVFMESLMDYTCACFIIHACNYGGPSWPIPVHPSCPMPVLMEDPHGLCLCTLHALCMCLWRPLMAYTCAPFMPHACTYGGPSWPIPVHLSCPMPVHMEARHGLYLCNLHVLC